MLLGTYPVRLAGNHRTSIPAPLREELGEKVVIAKWYEECLVLISKSSLEALLTRIIGSQTLVVDPVRGSEHFIFSSAYELEPDDQGRIVIPENLINFSKLSEDIYFLGIRDRVEIWDKGIWDEKEKTISKDAHKYIEELARIGNGG